MNLLSKLPTFPIKYLLVHHVEEFNLEYTFPKFLQIIALDKAERVEVI